MENKSKIETSEKPEDFGMKIPKEEGQEPPKPEKEPQETPEKPEKPSLEELEKRAKGLYKAFKEEEQKRKELEAKLKEKGEKITPKIEKDVFDLAKTVSALKDYSSDELDYISLISKAKGIPPEEATKTEEVELWIQARREKVAKEKKIPGPSSAGAISRFGRSAKEIAEMKREEHKKLVEEYQKTQTGGTGI